VGGYNGAGGEHVAVGAADDRVDGEEIVLDDRVADGQGEEREAEAEAHDGIRKEHNVPEKAQDEIERWEEETKNEANEDDARRKPRDDRLAAERVPRHRAEKERDARQRVPEPEYKHVPWHVPVRVGREVLEEKGAERHDVRRDRHPGMPDHDGACLGK